MTDRLVPLTSRLLEATERIQGPPILRFGTLLIAQRSADIRQPMMAARQFGPQPGLPALLSRQVLVKLPCGTQQLAAQFLEPLGP